MLSETTEEQVIKALRDAHKFLLECDFAGHRTELQYTFKANASRVRAEVDHALQLMGKL